MVEYKDQKLGCIVGRLLRATADLSRRLGELNTREKRD